MRSLLLGALLAILFVVPQSASAFPADFDGDGKADPTIWRPSTGVWYVRPSNPLGTCPSQMTSTGYGGCYIQWGLPGDKPITGDFDADGKADFSVWRPSNQRWYIRYSSLGSIDFQFPTGNTNSNDLPDEGDINKDGRSDIFHIRPSANQSQTTFSRVYANGAITETQYSTSAFSPNFASSRFPASANYVNHIDGLVGSDEIAFMHKYYVGSNVYGAWCYQTKGPSPYSACNAPGVVLGSGSVLVSGDYGGGVSPTAFAEAIEWIPLNGIWNIRYFDSVPTTSSTSWGNTGDTPVNADYTGDKINDYTVFRPNYNASGYSRWFFYLSSCLPYMTPTGFGGCYLDWGLPGDEPVS